MPLQWSEIRQNATAFAREWVGVTSENAQAKTFWDEFFQVFGVSRKRQASFEWPVKLPSGKHGFIDVFWKGRLVAEHKSTGKDLDRAYRQARDYFDGLTDDQLPRYVIVSDFARFRLYDLEEDWETPEEFELADLPSRVELFGFIAGYQTRKYTEQDPVNIKAAEKLAKLHDRLAEVGYDGHQLEVYLVRLLLCLFADDTGIFMPSGAFEDYIREETVEDGRNVARALNELFDVLDTPEGSRLKTLSQQLSGFPYINGALFAESLRTASFDRAMRDVLIECCELDWGKISPAIFGSLFQGIMDQEVRRNLGAHYTSEKNILKVIEPLFLDDLRAELEAVGQNRRKLKAFHDKLASLNFFDPACGCGNFLVITYREIRLLELEVLKRLHEGEQQQLTLDVAMSMIRVNVDQFHGIEIEEWPAQIARVAMWLMDHQMNVLVGETFGQAIVRIPLVKSANIVNANALQIEWKSVVQPEQCDYVLGNPPFVGKKEQNKEQKAEVLNLYGPVSKDAGLIDYVGCWFLQAVRYARDNKEIEIGFVATKSITHGEQVKAIWTPVLEAGVTLKFAHHSFKWDSEAKGKAAVFVVVIGLSFKNSRNKRLFTYSKTSSEPTELRVSQINPYLAPAKSILIGNRSRPLCEGVPKLIEGVTPLDNGLLCMSQAERDDYLLIEPAGERWIRPWITGKTFINGGYRYCFWLVDVKPNELRTLPVLRAKIEKVRQFRLQSKSSQKFALTPWLFRETSVPKQFLFFPKTSSERRRYVPVGFVADGVPSSSALYAEGGLYEFGVMISIMSMGWLSYVGGRLKGDYRYSAKLVYNNFPWPVDATDKQEKAIEAAAQGVLDARAQYPGSTLADLYDPLSMPATLVKAHQTLDRAVDAAYVPSGGKRTWRAEADRVAFLFELYERLASQESSPNGT
jgi:hypothetical protein